MEGVSEAEYLFVKARWCRDFIVDTIASLRDKGWADSEEAQFEQAFWNLVDVWTTYRRVMSFLPGTGFGGDRPTPGQVLADLQAPRRAFIKALDIYRVQLLTVQRYLPDADVTGAG
jgi:hypothetical protein